MELIYHPESDSYFHDVWSESLANQGCHTIEASSLNAGQRLPAGCGESTVMPDLDFETYSEVGFVWNELTHKWGALEGANKKSISAVGAAVYSEHPSTEVLSLAYNLKNGEGAKLWVPSAPLPLDLFNFILNGGILEAWNDSFEYWIWLNVAHKKMGWPILPFTQLRDAAAKARAFCLPGALGNAGAATKLDMVKDKEGKRLINKFSIPRNPTKSNPATRIHPNDDPLDAANIYLYNITDIEAESALSAYSPDLLPIDEKYFLATRALNVRGMAVDSQTVEAGIAILDQAFEKYNDELNVLTSGEVVRASMLAKLTKWVRSQGIFVGSLDSEGIEHILARTDLPLQVRRALEIRQLVGSAGVKKLYAISRQTASDGRLHDLVIFNGSRTGRDTGADVQPLNLVKAGPKLSKCKSCGTYWGAQYSRCRACDGAVEKMGWTWEAVDQVCGHIRKRSLPLLEELYGDALLAISGVIRGMFVAGEGKELICSDYSSIEAVVAAVLSGEEWRIEAFRNKEDIYLVSASRITGTPAVAYTAYSLANGAKHPDRQKIGKPAELGLGFGGWLNGWRQFDSTDTFTDDEVKKNIIAWRDASPAIVEMWGGQSRGKPWQPEYTELYGLEGMAISAILEPGKCFAYRDISFGVKEDRLYMRLPSGRMITYHRPRLSPSDRWPGQVSISFEGWNTNPTNGARGWVRMNTFGGRLFENCVQAVANDILRFACVSLEEAGIPHVLRVHDEIVAEVDKGTGDIPRFEALMATMPPWAKDWPIRASGGWIGSRYRKD